MPYCIFDKKTKEFLGGIRWDVPEYDKKTQVMLKLEEWPDPKIHQLNSKGNGVIKKKKSSKKSKAK